MTTLYDGDWLLIEYDIVTNIATRIGVATKYIYYNMEFWLLLSSYENNVVIDTNNNNMIYYNEYWILVYPFDPITHTVQDYTFTQYIYYKNIWIKVMYNSSTQIAKDYYFNKYEYYDNKWNLVTI